MIRGDVCYYPYPEPRRSVVVLTRTDAIVFLNDVTIIAPLTTAIRDSPIAHLSYEKMDEIREAIMFAFGYED